MMLMFADDEGNLAGSTEYEEFDLGRINKEGDEDLARFAVVELSNQ